MKGDKVFRVSKKWEGIIKDLKIDIDQELATLIFENGKLVLIESQYGIDHFLNFFGGEDNVKGKKISYEVFPEENLMICFEI